MRCIGQFGKTSHVGEEHRDFAPGAAEFDRLGFEQFVDDVGRDDFGKNGFDAAPLSLLEDKAIRDEG